MNRTLNVLRSLKNDILCLSMESINGNLYVNIDDVIRKLDSKIVDEVQKKVEKKAEEEII